MYRTGRYFSYRYINTYVSFRFKFWPILDCIDLTRENRVFRPVKKKLEKHTTKNEKSQENVIVTAFSLATFYVSPSCSTVLVLQPSSYPYFFFNLLLCFTCFSCGCTEDLAGRHANQCSSHCKSQKNTLFVPLCLSSILFWEVSKYCSVSKNKSQWFTNVPIIPIFTKVPINNLIFW